MTCGIYGIRNLVNGKWYVGQSVQIEARKRIHICLLGQGRHYNDHLQKAFGLYGLDNFEWRILERVSAELLDARECAWIEYYRSDQREFGYNLTGGGGQYRQVSLETREKLSKGRLKYFESPDARKALSESRKRSPLAKAQIRAVQLANMGRKRSAAACQKMSKSHTGVPWSERRRNTETRKQLARGSKQ